MRGSKGKIRTEGQMHEVGGLRKPQGSNPGVEEGISDKSSGNSEGRRACFEN